MVLDKSISYAEGLMMNDIMHKIISQDVEIDNYFKTHTRDDLIHLLQEEYALLHVLYDIQFKINHEHLKRYELLHLVLDKIISYAKERMMNDIVHKIINQDVEIDNYFKTHTREEFIDLLQYEDVLIDELYDIQYEISGRC